MLIRRGALIGRLKDCYKSCSITGIGLEPVMALSDVIEIVCALPAVDTVQKPRLLSKEDFVNNPNVDQYGYLAAWCEDKSCPEICRHDLYVECIQADAIDEAEECGDFRYWTSKPSEEQMTETSWKGDEPQDE